MGADPPWLISRLGPASGEGAFLGYDGVFSSSLLYMEFLAKGIDKD